MKQITFKEITRCQPIDGICKQHGLWLKGVNGANAAIAPLVYFQKPKWIEEKQWLEIMDSLQFMYKK